MIPLRLRLPSRFELELAGLAALIFLAAAYLRERQKVAARDAIIAARPATEEEVREIRVEGPVRVVEKIVAGEVVERETMREVVRVERDSSRSETPACPPAPRPKTRYAGLAAAPDAWRRPRVSAGLTLADRLDLGAYYDSRYAAFGLETRVRW